jgi:hypothetical protein
MRIFGFGATIVLLVSLFDAGMVAGGCSSDNGARCEDYVPPASFDQATPTMSFARDVMPIFSTSCAFTSCHGTAFGDANGVFLGGTNPAKVFAAIVDVPSRELPTMSYVKPGAPHDSFLMRKLDGSQCLLNATCANADCGQSMPRDEDRLDLDQRDRIRRWIAQGAKNN